MSLDYDQLQFSFKNSAGLKLLQSTNAPFTISFLYHQFKRAQRVTIPLPELVEKLEDYLEMLHETEPERYRNSASNYLNLWCDDDHQFLRKYYQTGSDDPVFELTPGTENAIRWLEELNQSEFVGTESRFLRIFDLLSEIVAKSTEDPQERLAQLQQQQAAIQQEIDRITQTGQVERYTDTQIKERFFEANDTARRLLADFREVEQNFRDLTRQIQEQRVKEGVHKGVVLATVLDADEALKESDQGRSFYAFWGFLMSRSKQEALRELLNKTHQLPELAQLAQNNPLLRQIKTNLITAGEKIIQSNQRLAAQLRKILDDQQAAEGRRIMALIDDIKRLNLSLIDQPLTDGSFLALEVEPQLNAMPERPLWSPPEKPDFNTYHPALAEEDLQAIDLTSLYTQFYVDEHRLRQNIDKLLTQYNQVTLAEVTERYPVEKGLSEVVTYLAIAAKDENHAIDDSIHDRITYLNAASYPNEVIADETMHHLTLPQVIFRR